MISENDKSYNKKISKRIIEILDYSNLEIKGIAAITNKSIDIFYAIINLRKKLSQELATAIGNALDFDGNIIFNINIEIPDSIRQSQNLKKFRDENINNTEYFSDLWSANKDSTFIKRELIYNGFFSKQRYTWEISDKLRVLKRDIRPDLLKSHLKYLVTKNELKSKLAPLKKRNGGYGTRLVNVYYL